MTALTIAVKILGIAFAIVGIIGTIMLIVPIILSLLCAIKDTMDYLNHK
jgi:ABC-type cobalamin transport system permease subunit